MSLRDKIRAYRPQKSERRPFRPGERELVAMKARVLEEWQASGKYTAKDEHGNWRYGIADLNREAEARMKRQSA